MAARFTFTLTMGSYRQHMAVRTNLFGQVSQNNSEVQVHCDHNSCRTRESTNMRTGDRAKQQSLGPL